MVLVIGFGYGQYTQPTQGNELPNIIPPSPTVASLMHFEEVPIDYYSGQPDIQLPIYTKNVGSGLAIPISLRYNTMGLRIDERSGWTGTGWALDGEAVISRTVQHIRDEAELDNAPDTPNEVGVYHNGFFELDFDNPVGNINNETVNRFLWNATSRGSGSHILHGDYDKEPDLYQLSLFGKHARFIIIKNTTGALEVKMLSNDNNLKVIPHYDVTTYHITSFTVTDTSGISYLMNVTEVSTTNSAALSILQNGENTESSQRPKHHVSAWKVKEIRNSANQILATYHYQGVTESFDTPDSFIEARYSHYNSDILSKHFLGMNNNDATHAQFHSYNSSIIKPKLTISQSSITVASQKVKSIVFKDDTKIDFILSNYNHPEYKNSGSVLEEIKIFNTNNHLFKRFDLVYQTTSNNLLFLDKLIEYYKEDTNSFTYDLTYKDKELLPFQSTRENDSYKYKDLWGYYKQYTPNQHSIYTSEKSADKDHVGTGSLTAISYPMGGKKEFEFESNEFSSLGFRDFTEQEFKNLNPDNWKEAKQEEVIFDPHGSDRILDDQKYITIAEQQEALLRFNLNHGNLNDPLTSNGLENIIIHLYKVAQQPGVNETILEETINSPFEPGRDISVVLTTGLYKLYYTNMNAYSGDGPDFQASATLSYKTFKENFDHTIHGGGLRIKSVTFRDTDHSIKRQFRYAYTQSEVDTRGIPGQGEYASTGVVDGLLTNIRTYQESIPYVVFQLGGYKNISGLTPLGVTNAPSTGENSTSPGNENLSLIGPYKALLKFDVKEHLNSTLVSMTKNNYVGYRKVSVTEQDKGRTVYEYTSPSDFPTYSEGYDKGKPFPVKDKSHLHGALVKQKIYNGSNRVLKEVTNTYHDPIRIPQAFWVFTEYGKACEWLQFYTIYDSYVAKSRVHSNLPSFYDASGKINNCNKDDEPNNAAVHYKKFYHYYSRYLMRETHTKDYFYKESDVPSIAETRQTYEYDPSNYKISIQNTYLTEGENETHYQTKFYYPGSSFAGNYSSYSALVSQNKIEEVVATEKYKDSKMLSASYTTYRNFEDNTALPEYIFTIKGDVRSTLQPGVPGPAILLDGFEKRISYRNYDRYSNPLEVSKETGATISYIWGYDHQYPIAKIENADYEKIRLALGLATTQEVKNLDEGDIATINSLRDLPLMSDSLITTYTYDPMIGATSMTDAKGYTMYYEYDGFNRLEFVKDADGNLISENKYHYKNN